MASFPRACRQSETGGSVDAKDGIGCHLSEAQALGYSQTVEDVSLSTEGIKYHQTEPGLGNGYNLYSLDPWFCLSGSGYGLVFPLRVVVGTFKLTRRMLLSVGSRTGTYPIEPLDIQQRPRQSIYF